MLNQNCFLEFSTLFNCMRLLKIYEHKHAFHVCLLLINRNKKNEISLFPHFWFFLRRDNWYERKVPCWWFRFLVLPFSQWYIEFDVYIVSDSFAIDTNMIKFTRATNIHFSLMMISFGQLLCLSKAMLKTM